VCRGGRPALFEKAAMFPRSKPREFCVRGAVSILLLTLVFAGLSTPRTSSALPHGVPLGRAFAFGEDPNQIIYFYPGERAGPHKVMAIIHGGGWISGAPDGEREVIPIFTSNGFSVVNIGYRLYPQVDGQGEVRDVAEGLAYILSKSEELDLDPRNISLLGHSAGGHIAALLGTDVTYLQNVNIAPGYVRKIVVLDGIFDLSGWARHKREDGKVDNVTKVFGAGITGLEQMSPLNRVSSLRMHPKYCLIAQDSESHFAEQARSFAAALKNRNESVDLLVVSGLDRYCRKTPAPIWLGLLPGLKDRC
jgi:arylformamidase